MLSNKLIECRGWIQTNLSQTPTSVLPSIKMFFLEPVKFRHLMRLVELALLLSGIQVNLSCLEEETPPRLGQNGTDSS